MKKNADESLLLVVSDVILSPLVQVMACCLLGTKTLPEWMLVKWQLPDGAYAKKNYQNRFSISVLESVALNHASAKPRMFLANKTNTIAAVALGPFYKHGLTLILVWISNYIHHKVSGEITHIFPNFNGCPIEVWEWINNFISHVTGMWLLIHAGIKVNPWMLVSPGYQTWHSHQGLQADRCLTAKSREVLNPWDWML